MSGQCSLTCWFVRTRPASSFQAKAGVKDKGRWQRRQTSSRAAPQSRPTERHRSRTPLILYTTTLPPTLFVVFEQSSQTRSFEEPIIRSSRTFAPLCLSKPSLAGNLCIQLTASRVAGIRITDDTVCELSRIPITSNLRVTINNVVRPNPSGTFHTSPRSPEGVACRLQSLSSRNRHHFNLVALYCCGTI